MDAGTADLLSELEELENSLPGDNEPSPDTGWSAATGFGAPTDAPHDEPAPGSPVATAPPAPIEQPAERLVSDEQGMEPVVDPMFSTGHGGLEIEPLAGPLYGERAARETRARSEDLQDRLIRATATSPPVTSTGAGRWSGRLLLLLAIVVVVAGIVAGVKYFKRGGTESAPSAPSEPAASTPSSALAAPGPVPVTDRSSARRSHLLASPIGAEPSSRVRISGAEKEPGTPRAPSPSRPPRPTPPATSESSPGPRVAAPPAASPKLTPAAPPEEPVRPGPAPAADVRPTNQVSPAPEPAAETKPAGQEQREAPAAEIAPTERREGPAGPPPAPPSTSGPLVRIGELDEPLQLVHSSTPPLPPEAREAGVAGRVFLSVLVGEDGGVREARVLVEPGHGLGAAAREAVLTWRYTIPRRNGEAVRVWKTEVVEFKAPEGTQ